MRMRTWFGGLILGWCLTGVGAAADVILNEYNAVGSSNLLDGGTGADSFFGLIAGNGGNWFELMVIGDHVDMRGWQLIWNEDEQVAGGATAQGTITLSNHDIWSDLRSGTLITMIETTNAGGVAGFNTATDVSYNPLAGDWWIHVSTQGEAVKGADALVTTVTNDGAPGDFSVGRNDWTLEIRNAQGANVFGPVGEGAVWGDGINGEEAGALEGPLGQNGQPATLAQWTEITPASPLYDDTGSTSFGSINGDFEPGTGAFIPQQDVSPLRAWATSSPTEGDFDGDGLLTAADIDALSAAVRTGSTDTRFDVNSDGTVSDADRQVWVEQLKRTYFGDADLNGEFASSDLVTVLTAGLYEDAIAGNAGWGSGDWNGDGDFTTSDFVTALQGGGYETGPRAAVAAVPEPAAGGLLATGALLMLGYRRQSSRE